ncbi:MAG: aldolase [Rhodospirillaceae bacterium]|nr:aldolase [Rhodospirillaceae bacterium]
MERVYGTCVALAGEAILFRGPSGSGKSDLALRVIEAGGKLVADDQTILTREGNRLIATCPNSIAGRLEIRGIGIVPVETIHRAPLSLVLDMVPPEQVERFPKTGECSYLDVNVPLLPFSPFEVAAAAKVRLALKMIRDQ